MSVAPTPPGEIVAGIREGDLLLDKYRAERVIGSGGMGVVISAMHVELEHRVAIKMLLPAVLENPEAVARFARESRAAVKIRSEHVARVSDVGRLPNGCPYMVMEYLEGTDLTWLVERTGQIAVREAVDFVLQASEAIAEAHSLGIVHRDLKPSNLFVIERADGSKSIKVLDFGISKVTPGLSASGAPALDMTQTSVVLGSPVYMSPEQLASTRDADARSDIWALGAIIYELLAARPPFMADTLPQLCMAITQGSPPPMATFRRDVPAQLEAVILRCLAKNAADRFGDVSDLARALIPFATDRGAGSAEVISRILSRRAASTASPSSYPDRSPSGETLGSWWHRAKPGGPARWAVGLGAATVLAVVAVVIALRANRVEPAPPAILAAPLAAEARKGAPSGSPSPSAAEPNGKVATHPTGAAEPNGEIATHPTGAADAGAQRISTRSPPIHTKPAGKPVAPESPRPTAPRPSTDDDVFQNRR
ncbi:MAG TPA: serine/threonine-protein kinase [Polyangiaceae bacterium]|nr:serine/threonine-protein kinase [Polyangiaceae bacterium]